MPDRVGGCAIAVPAGAGDHHAVEAKLEQGMVVLRGGHRELGSFGHELLRQPRPYSFVVHLDGAARRIERVFVVGGRERVEREATVAPQVLLLGPRTMNACSPSGDSSGHIGWTRGPPSMRTVPRKARPTPTW